MTTSPPPGRPDKAQRISDPQTTSDRIETFSRDMKACVYFNQNMADACNAGKALTVFPENFRKLPQTGNWRPFESMPKDGSRFLARLDEHQDITILHWEQYEFQDDGDNYVPVKWITGWMSLPDWKATVPPSDFWFVEQIMNIFDKVALDAKNGKHVFDGYAFDVLKIVRGKNEDDME